MGFEGEFTTTSRILSRLIREVMPRAFNVEVKERGSVRSTLEIEPRTPTVKLNWIMVQPSFSCREFKNSSTGAYRLLFSASFFSSQSSEESIARVNSRIAKRLLL